MMSMFHEGESRGGQFQKLNDRLPKPNGGLHSHSAMERELPHWGQQTSPVADCFIHSPIAGANLAASSASANVLKYARQSGQVRPSQTGPKAHSLKCLPILGSTPFVRSSQYTRSSSSRTNKSGN